jgi:RecB family endonuclease NucS
MPQPIRQPVEAAPRVGLQHVAVAVEVGDVGDLVGFDAVLDVAVPELQRRGFDRAEISREGNLAVVVERLAAKHHDRVAVDGIFDGLPVDRAQRFRQVDAADLGHEFAMHWRNGDAHDRLPRL